MFKSEEDIRNFRDVLSAILKDQKDKDDESEERIGRKRNLRTLDAAIGNPNEISKVDKNETSERDMTGVSMHTDDQFMVTDRMHLGQSGQKSSRDLIIKCNEVDKYKSPIVEENIESDANLNISTNENISIADKHDRNR